MPTSDPADAKQPDASLNTLAPEELGAETDDTESARAARAASGSADIFDDDRYRLLGEIIDAWEDGAGLILPDGTVLRRRS